MMMLTSMLTTTKIKVNAVVIFASINMLFRKKKMPQLHQMQIYFIKKPHQIEINGYNVYITIRSRQLN